jgi:hypothetical protein
VIPSRAQSWAAALLVLGPQGAAPRTLTLDPGFELAGHHVSDLDGDGRAEFVVLARDGRVRSFRPLSSEPERALGELVLATPERVLLALARFGDAAYLVAETPEGTLAYPLDEEGVVGASGATWIARARLGLRLGAPTFAEIVQDVNRDGVNDVLVPTLAGVELWQGRLEPGSAAPSFRKAATVAVAVERSATHEFRALSDGLASSIVVPGLDRADVNGDGREDLLVAQGERRAWHLQRADASFPLEPDVVLDLSIFRDTTPAAETRFGGTLAGDEASFASRDLDGDSVPDYVIAHRRKVWVFRGGPGGPQFTEPSAILKTAEDVTALVVLRLDEDALADLLLVKVQVPTLATLLRGLFGEWDVHVRALGYANTGAGKFETSPSLSNDLALRLPGIVGLVKNPERLVQRFEELEKRFRAGARGDVDGDGAEDLLLVTPDGKALELWRGRPGDPPPDRRDEGALRGLLFGERDAVWDLERLLALLGDIAERQVALATEARPADASVALRDPARSAAYAVECADLDGDGASEVVVSYRDVAQPRSGRFDVLVLGD